MLAAFRVRSFRFQWPADLLTSWAFEMETLILGWYVMVHTGSVLLLTVFGSLQFLGTLAAPMFGVLGDRLGARAMFFAMRGIYAGFAAVLMGLGFAGLVSPATVFVIATLSGLVRPNDLVVRNQLIGETMPPAHLIGALGLSRASTDAARVVGALAGAALSAALGFGAAYAFVTICYLGSLALTFGVAAGRPLLDPATAARGAVSRPSRYRDLKDGLLHVAGTPTLVAVVVLAFLINLSAYPVTSGLLPYVAERIYRVGATGLGWLSASFSLGALLGSVAIVVTGGARRPERAMLVHTAAWYVLLLMFANVRSFGVGLVLLVVAGFVQSVAMISLMGTLLPAADPRFRGRVVGVRTLAVYGLPLGLLAAGAVIERAGYAPTISLFCGVGLAMTGLIGVRWRASLWRRAGRSAPVATPQRVS